jgi:hypothetical protein
VQGLQPPAIQKSQKTEQTDNKNCQDSLNSFKEQPPQWAVLLFFNEIGGWSLQ